VIAGSLSRGSEKSRRQNKPNKNAAQASHLGRIARECDVYRLHRVKRRNVEPGNRTPEGAYVHRHTLNTINLQT
jgi:hypothetical protein